MKKYTGPHDNIPKVYNSAWHRAQEKLYIICCIEIFPKNYFTHSVPKVLLLAAAVSFYQLLSCKHQTSLPIPPGWQVAQLQGALPTLRATGCERVGMLFTWEVWGVAPEVPSSLSTAHSHLCTQSFLGFLLPYLILSLHLINTTAARRWPAKPTKNALWRGQL